MMTPSQYDGSEVPVLPGKDLGSPARGHRHDGEIGQVDPRVQVALRQSKG